MRLPSRWVPVLALFLAPFGASADTEKTYSSKDFDENTAIVEKINGTVMVQKADGSKPFALGSYLTVEKGDTLTVYDKSWVILRDRNGDRIGLDGDTLLTFDEFFIKGPDRQIRLLMQRGGMLLKSNGRDSRQSFFEVNTGSVVTALNDTQCVLQYEPKADTLDVKFLRGKLTVVDKDSEEKFKVENSENTWKAGKMQNEEPEPVEELDVINFNKFFDGEPRLTTPSNSFLLPGSD